MLTIQYQTAFKKDYKRIKRRGYNTALLETVIGMLAAGQALSAEYRDHNRTGDYRGSRECHIAPGWLLMYEISGKELILYPTRTGTHSDIFGD